MTFGQAIFSILIGGTFAVLAAWRLWSRNSPPLPHRDSLRRAGGNALFLMEEFVNPRVEHVVTTRQDQVEDDVEAGGDDDPEALAARVRDDLRASLASDAIDADEVLRHLTSATRAGLDWRALYQAEARAVAAASPFRAPFLPPSWRVAPRDIG